MRVLLLLSALGCGAVQKPDALDAIGEAAFGVSMYLDYSQTVQITRDGWEHNPIIGQRGQNFPPAPYVVTTFVLHAVIAYALPRPWRTVWQGGWTVVEGMTVWDNYTSGYSP